MLINDRGKDADFDVYVYIVLQIELKKVNRMFWGVILRVNIYLFFSIFHINN